MLRQHLLPASYRDPRTQPRVAFSVKAANPAGCRFLPLRATCLSSAPGWAVVGGTGAARARPRCINRAGLRSCQPPGRKDVRVSWIGGAIYGASHVQDYTTSWVAGGRPRARRFAAGVPLSLPSAPLQLSRRTTRTAPPPLSERAVFLSCSSALTFRSSQ